jgi:hypothetical protein
MFGRLPAQRRLRDADDRVRLAGKPKPVPHPQLLSRRVALIEHRLPHRAPTGEVPPASDLRRRHQPEPRLPDVDARDRTLVEVEVLPLASGRAARRRPAGTRGPPAEAEAVLRHPARDMHRRQRQRRRHRLHTRNPGDPRRLALGEGELAGGDEVVARDLRAALERAEVESRALVLLAELLLLGRRKPRAGSESAEALHRARPAHLQRPVDRHVGADAGERLEHLGLGVVEALRQRGHRHDQPHPDREPQRREQRATLPPPQLREDVGDVEHAGDVIPRG